MRADVLSALLQTLVFHAVWGHAPTPIEWLMTVEWPDEALSPSIVFSAMDELVKMGKAVVSCGRYAPAASGRKLIDELRWNELWRSRKLRAARRVVKWLSRLSSVRFVALCNTTALGHARDAGDLDFFVIARQGTLMATRGLAALPYSFLKRRPGEGDGRDAVCLSYFVADDGLDLSSHMLQPDDPYFRYWFLSLLPLYDDGVSEELWRANEHITRMHPFARPWLVSSRLAVPRPGLRLPVPSVLEAPASAFQQRRFPRAIRELMNKDTRVMVTPQVLKFHVEDGREEYRRAYEEACQRERI